MPVAAAASPESVLATLRALSLQLRAGVVLDAQGAAIAGDPALVDAAHALLDGASRTGAGVRWSSAADGGALVAARGERHAICLHVADGALRGLVEHDLRDALDELDPRRGADYGVRRGC